MNRTDGGTVIVAGNLPAHTLSQLVACIGGVVSLTEALLWRLTVLKLVAASDETRFVEAAAAEVDMAASELAEAEQVRSELVLRLTAEAGMHGVDLTLSAIAANSPEGVATALTAYRRRLNSLTAEIESTSGAIRRHIGVSMRHLDAVLGEVRGTSSTYAADGRTAAAPARPRLQRFA